MIAPLGHLKGREVLVHSNIHPAAALFATYAVITLKMLLQLLMQKQSPAYLSRHLLGASIQSSLPPLRQEEDKASMGEASLKDLHSILGEQALCLFAFERRQP
eukprot:1158102-Pelagomonas_calceolata.AAC.1